MKLEEKWRKIQRAMKSDWNKRADENARLYIATSSWESEEVFDESGKIEARLFFEGKEANLLREDAVLLDIGCGIGRIDKHLAPRVGRLCGVDVSARMVEKARQRLSHLENVEFHEIDGLTLDPISGDSIDIVFSHIVFQHIPREVVAGFFREAFRVLKPGGSFLFTVPGVIGTPLPPDPPDHDTLAMARFYDEAGLRKQLEALGFEWVESRGGPVKTPELEYYLIRPWVRKPLR